MKFTILAVTLFVGFGLSGAVQASHYGPGYKHHGSTFTQVRYHVHHVEYRPSSRHYRVYAPPRHVTYRPAPKRTYRAAPRHHYHAPRTRVIHHAPPRPVYHAPRPGVSVHIGF